MTVTPQTFVYDANYGTKLDAYLPTFGPQDKSRVPVIVHFHGGGLVAGSRNDILLSSWISETLPSKGFLVLSADYRLLYPSTADDIIADVHTLFSYVASPTTELSSALSSRGLTLDTTRIVVSGESGGNFPAKAAATLASVQPRPIAWLDRFGQGGDWLADHYVKPYDALPFTKFVRYEETHAIELDQQGGGKVVTESGSRPREDGRIRDDLGRFDLYVYWLKEALYVDRFLELPGISAKLAAVPYSKRLALIPAEKRHLLLPITPHTCPAFIAHGTADGMVSIGESEAIAKEMEEQGLEVEKRWREGDSHGFFDIVTLQPSAGSEKLVKDILCWIDKKVKL
ncbi:hypothetical protein I350_05547 [Cryptococcus amylolentus CBS 6273]|nr:hypothetical protein I350_05547 [Cryptococcus amylolentus CBS 6273]